MSFCQEFGPLLCSGICYLGLLLPSFTFTSFLIFYFFFSWSSESHSQSFLCIISIFYPFVSALKLFSLLNTSIFHIDSSVFCPFPCLTLTYYPYFIQFPTYESEHHCEASVRVIRGPKRLKCSLGYNFLNKNWEVT